MKTELETEKNYLIHKKDYANSVGKRFKEFFLSPLITLERKLR